MNPVRGDRPPLYSPYLVASRHRRHKLRDEARSLSGGERRAGDGASAFSPEHGRGSSHPPALGKSGKFKGTPLEPRQRGFAPLHSPKAVWNCYVDGHGLEAAGIQSVVKREATVRRALDLTASAVIDRLNRASSEEESDLRDHTQRR